jgi:hypothetical protein
MGRDADDKLMLLFAKPKSEEGKGILRLDKNLWTYDPGTGKWDRTTERERVGGTNTRRSDFDESRLTEEFDPSFVGEEKLGKLDVHHLLLSAKDGVDVAYLDGTFFDGSELPERNRAEIRHPLMTRTMELLGDVARKRPGALRFLHLNHTNPALHDPEVRRRIEHAGFAIASEGERVSL